MDFMACVDPTDIHFAIVRLDAPTEFDLPEAQIRYVVGGQEQLGPGSLHAGLGRVTASMQLGIAALLNSLNERTAGQLITQERYGTLYTDAPQGAVLATGAFVEQQSLGAESSLTRFHVHEILVHGPASGSEVAFTRETYIGARLLFLVGCLSTPHERGFTRDRIEEHAFGRRLSLRHMGGDDKRATTCVVYDGSPLEGLESQALWLALSFSAAASQQPVVTETFDSQGRLVETRYQPGVPPGAAGQSPFHLHYAQYHHDVFAQLCDRILQQLESEFPIDVIIAYLLDANEGAMERCMQSCLLGIHAASEAWTRNHGETTLLPKEQWKEVRVGIIAAGRTEAKKVSNDLAESVERAIGNANNTETNARLRRLFGDVGFNPQGALKKAIELRNALLHDGYFKRRFGILTSEEQQERYDQLRLLREFVTRLVFAVLDIEVPIHSIINPYTTTNIRDQQQSAAP